MIRKFIITAVAATVIAASAAPAMAGGIYIDQTGFGNQVGGSQSGWNNTFGTKQTGWWNKGIHKSVLSKAQTRCSPPVSGWKVITKH